MSAKRAAVYARISTDDGSALGVARQVQDCTREAERRGWTVAEAFVDNDVSASTGRKRPEYDRMMKALRGGEYAALVVWDVDRLTRTPAELEEFISLADARSVALASVGGEIDLGTPQGRLTARIKGSVARHEVEQSSRRLRRKFLERAEQGKPHGGVAYGYQRQVILDADGRRKSSRDVLDPAQAKVVTEAADRLLAGESIRAVYTDLNRQHVPSPRGKPWDGTMLRQVLLRERNASLRTHRGQVVGKGDWPPIYDEDTHARIVALLRDPGRRSNRGSERRYLLSGLGLCGRCGGSIRVTTEHRRPDGATIRAAYHCRECFRVRRVVHAVDEVVEGVIVARLSQPDGPDLLSGDPAALRQATVAVATVEAKLATAADQFAADDITGDQLRRITGKLRPLLAAAQSEVRVAAPSTDLAPLAGPDIGEHWSGLSLDVKRAVIDMLVIVTIMPTGSGRPFDPELVEISWKGAS